MKAFLDSVVVIYLVEQPPNFGAMAWNALSRLMPTALVVNPLTRLDCLVGPRRNADFQTELDFDSFFSNQCQPFVPIDDPVYDLALNLKAKYVGLKTPDALQLATAIHAGCDVFVTNDHRLSQVTEIQVVRI